MFTQLWSSAAAAEKANNETSATPPVQEIVPAEQAQKLLTYFHENPDAAINQTVEWLIETKKSYGGSDEYLSLKAWTGALFAKYDNVPNERLGHAIIALQAVKTEHDLTLEFRTETERKLKTQAKGDAALKKIFEFIQDSRAAQQGNAFTVTTYPLYHDSTLSNKWLLFLLTMVGTKIDQYQVALHGKAIFDELQRAQQRLAVARQHEDDIVVETLVLDDQRSSQRDPFQDVRYLLG